jgi:putative ABC transport system substrate-binding protein
VNRREVITLLGGAVAWPVAARAQQPERVRHVAVLVASAEHESDIQERLSGFRQGLEKRGWSEGRNILIDIRFAAGRAEQYTMLAREQVALRPDVIFAQSPPIATAFRRETRTIPIVFSSVSDPIGAGLVASLARPGGNLTGVLQYEAGIAGKWLAMLKEIAPQLERAALIGNRSTTAFDYWLEAATTAAPTLALELVSRNVASAADIEQAIAGFARKPNGALLLPPDATTIIHRNLIIALAARHRLPAVYALRVFVAAGGLMAYGTNQVEQFRQAASYVDRILRGAKPADLPVQVPTKYETTLNLKAAKMIGLEVPASLLVRADEVIE